MVGWPNLNALRQNCLTVYMVQNYLDSLKEIYHVSQQNSEFHRFALALYTLLQTIQPRSVHDHNCLQDILITDRQISKEAVSIT